MMLEKTTAIIGIIGSVAGGAFFMENRYAHSQDLSSSVTIIEERIDKTQAHTRSLFDMNTAEIRLLIVDSDLQVLMEKPPAELTPFDEFKKEKLLRDRDFWNKAVMEAQSQLNKTQF